VPSDADQVLGIKIDVDTYAGMKNGVPRLLDILEDHQIRGTFFLSVGPDASGLAALQILKNPRFLKKMIRTNAAGLYGLRTAFYGTLLPSPMIALSFPETVRKIMDRGHEVQFHAWDHRRWQDDLPGKSREWIREWFEKGIRGFKQLTGRAPTAFGAPAWMIDDRVLEILEAFRFDYLSCTRAREPFVHKEAGIPEIPSDLPCFEETGIPEGIASISSILEDGQIHVLPVHAEVEGGIWSGHFLRLLEQIKKMDYRTATLGEIRNILPMKTLTVRKHEIALLPGRSVPCAV
jgi:undecaprenyl phosphate-alpha-L-ara4FN deformylase